MLKATAATTILVYLAMPTLALADEHDAVSLFKERGCANCHDVKTWKMGPPLKSVATKYRGNRAAGEQRITAALTDGVGHPKTNASAEEIKAMVNWILSL